MCFYKFSDEKFNKESCDLVISGFDVDEIQKMVLNTFTASELTSEILDNVNNMFKNFILQKGLYQFIINGKRLNFYYS